MFTSEMIDIKQSDSIRHEPPARSLKSDSDATCRSDSLQRRPLAFGHVSFKDKKSKFILYIFASVMYSRYGDTTGAVNLGWFGAF